MKENKTINLVNAALFTALVIIATVIIRIPSPTQGYKNLGDCFVILSSWMIGPLYGALASGVGSAISDIIAGVPYYAIGSLFIKGLGALACALIFKKEKGFGNLIFSSIVCEIIVVLGYFGYASLILGRGLSASLSIPGNLIQGGIGIVLALGIYHLVKKAKVFKG